MPRPPSPLAEVVRPLPPVARAPFGPALVLLWFLAITGCAGGALLVMNLEEAEAAFHLAALATTLTLIGIFAYEYRKTNNALSPMCLAMLLMFLLYPFHGWMTEGTGILTATLGSDAHEWQVRALLVVALAALFLWWGFNSSLGAAIARRLPGPKFTIIDEDRSTRTKLIVLYVVALVPRVALYFAGQFFHFGGDRQAVEIQFLLNVLATVPAFVTTYFIVLGVRDRQRRILLIGLTMLLGEVAWGFISGSRLRMFEPVVAATVALSYVSKPVGLRRLVAGILIFAVVTLPFLTAFRGAYFDRAETIQREGLEVGTLVDALTAATKSDNDVTIVEGTGPFDELANRLHGLTSLALIMRYTPERADYTYGVPYLLIVPQVLIPRFLWPSKPEVGQFRETFKTLYWGLEPGTQTSIAVSQLGDLWSNLHLFGALGGSFFYGLFVAFLFRHLRYGVVNVSLFPIIVFCIHVTHLMHQLEGALDAAIAGFIKSLFVYFLVAWFLARRRVVEPT